jgi:hypothetical protein
MPVKPVFCVFCVFFFARSAFLLVSICTFVLVRKYVCTSKATCFFRARRLVRDSEEIELGACARGVRLVACWFS